MQKMDLTNKIKDKQKKQGINPIVAGVAGAVVGVGMAVAATQLQDKKTRQKVKDTLGNVKNQTMDYVQNLRTDEKLKEKTNKIKKIAKEAKKKN